MNRFALRRRFRPALLPMLVLASSMAFADEAPLETIATQPVREEQPAQESASADAAVRLDEIVVTGERIERLLVQTTSSVQVIDAADIDGSSMEDLYDVFARTANINATYANAGRSGGFAIRGISDAGVGSQSFGSSSDLASIVVDGVVLSGAGNRAGPLELWDVESVEVFRGPQSTNQGRNALAGAVILRTVEPSEAFDLRGRASIAEFDGEQQAVAIGGALPGPFTARLAAQRQVMDGSITNVTRDEPAAFRDRDNVRLKLGLQPQGWRDFSAMLTLSSSRDDRGQPRLAGDPRARQSMSDVLEAYEARTRLGSLHLNQFASDQWELSAITALSETSLDQQADYSGGPDDDGVIDNLTDDRTLSQELRASFGGLTLGGGALRGVFGLYGARVDSDRNTNVVDGYVGVGMLDVYLDGQTGVLDEQSTLAVFAESEWEFLPRWNLIAGGRYDWQRVEFDYRSNYDIALTREDLLGLGDVLGDQLGPSLGLPTDSEGDGRMDSAVFLPKLGLRRDGEDGLWSVGFTVQRAYRAGGLSVNFARGSFNEVDPEYTWTGELSLRAELLERRLAARANVYHTDWRDQQVSVQLSEDPNDAQTENAGRSHLYGVELELDWRMTATLSGFVSAGFAQTRFDRFEVTQFDRDAGEYVVVSYAGNEFPGAAPRQGGIGLRYAPPAFGPYAQVDLNYVDASYRQADNDPAQRADSYALLNAKLGWNAEWGGLYVSGRNLLDRFYVTQRAFGYFMVGEPRVVMLTVDFRL